MRNKEYKKCMSSELVDTQSSYSKKYSKRKWSWFNFIKTGLFRGFHFGLSSIRVLINRRDVLRNTELIRPFLCLTIFTYLTRLAST